MIKAVSELSTTPDLVREWTGGTNVIFKYRLLEYDDRFELQVKQANESDDFYHTVRPTMKHFRRDGHKIALACVEEERKIEVQSESVETETDNGKVAIAL